MIKNHLECCSVPVNKGTIKILSQVGLANESQFELHSNCYSVPVNKGTIKILSQVGLANDSQFE